MMPELAAVEPTHSTTLTDFPPRRFWDETKRVLGMYEYFRESRDNANALACFDQMARYSYRKLSQRTDFDPSKRSVISTFQPKSGGTFLHNRMLQLGYQDFWWCFTDQICPSYCYASFDALQLFMAGGCTCHTHARPEANILAAWDRAGVEKIWLHLRNPAEAAISSYYHFLGEGHGEGEIGAQRRKEALAEGARRGVGPGMAVSDFAVVEIAWHVDWVAGWLRYAAQHPDLVVLSYFSELADPQALISRVFSELGIELDRPITAAPMRDDRFRRHRATNWRSELTADAQQHLEQCVRGDLGDFPQFDRLWS
jgi:hypothetical protein